MCVYPYHTAGVKKVLLPTLLVCCFHVPVMGVYLDMLVAGGKSCFTLLCSHQLVTRCAQLPNVLCVIRALSMGHSGFGGGGGGEKGAAIVYSLWPFSLVDPPFPCVTKTRLMDLPPSRPRNNPCCIRGELCVFVSLIALSE